MKAVEFGGYLRTYHTYNGYLIENVFALTGGHPINDKVLLTGSYTGDPDVVITPDGSEWQPHVAAQETNGNGEHIYYYSGDGAWRDASGAVINGI